MPFITFATSQSRSRLAAWSVGRHAVAEIAQDRESHASRDHRLAVEKQQPAATAQRAIASESPCAASVLQVFTSGIYEGMAMAAALADAPVNGALK